MLLLLLHFTCYSQDIKRIIIDRSFVADGQRWIIDYKTSAPSNGQTVEAFVAAQALHYKHQLQQYAIAVGALDSETPIKTALYFPVIDYLHTVNFDD